MNYFLTKKFALKKVSLLLMAFIALSGVGMLLPHGVEAASTSPYAQFPTCPTSITQNPNTPTTCTYVDGSKTTCTFNGTYTCTNPDKSVTTCTPADPTADDANVTCSVSTASGASAGANTAAIPAAQQAGNGSATSCNIISPGTYGTCITDGIAIVALGLLGLAGFLLGVIGSLFNWIVVITVFQFGNYFGNSTGLLTAWGILRDIGNIMLLFGFVFMGILMILDLHTIDTRKAIPQLIIVALLLNFSLFAAEAVIDVSNVLSAALYNQAGGAGSECNTSNANTCANSGISSLVINATGLNGVFSSGNGLASAIGKIDQNSSHAMFVYIGLTLFVSVTAVVLLAACIMLIIRGVVLTFVMVLAPLGFAAMAIPPFAGLGKRWRDMLISQAFFAPVYLLLLLVSLKIMEAVKTSLLSNNSGTLLDALNTPGTAYGTIFIVFALVIGFMIAALTTAKSMGAIGADLATNIATRSVRGTVLAPVRVAGTAARVGGGVALRGTVGNTALRFGKNYDSTIARWQQRGGVLGGVAGALRATGADEAISGTAQRVGNTKFGGLRSAADEKKFQTARTSGLARIGEIDGLTKDIKAGIAKRATGETDEAFNARKSAAEKALQKIPQPDLKDLINKTTDKEQIANLSKMLTADKFEKAMEDHDINAGTLEDLAAARYADVANAATFDDMKKAARALSPKEKKLMARYEGSTFEKMLQTINPDNGESVLTADEARAINKDDSYNSTQRSMAYATLQSEQVKKALKERATATAEQQAVLTNFITNNLRQMNKDIADLGEEVITENREVLENLNATSMAGIMAKQEMSDAGKEKILRYIAERGAADPNDRQFQNLSNYLNKGSAGGWWGTLPVITAGPGPTTGPTAGPRQAPPPPRPAAPPPNPAANAFQTGNLP